MIRVTCAIIRNEDDDILIVQRGENSDHPFKWEFPGGKLHIDETEEECIIREIREELSVDIVIFSRMAEVEYDYGTKHILLIPFICDTLEDLPLLSEHIAFKWISSADLLKVDFSEADIIVAENYINSVKSSEVRNERYSIIEQQAIDDEGLQSMVNRMMGMKEAEWVATSAIENPAVFGKLLQFSFSSDKKLAFRASWTLTKACDKYPELIYPYLPDIVKNLKNVDNESVQRSFLRIISLTDIVRIEDKQHGLLADHCFSALKSGFSAIAVKAYSMEILYKLALIYPELANELSATVNMLQGEGSAGVIARGRIILKKLAEMPAKPDSV